MRTSNKKRRTWGWYEDEHFAGSVDYYTLWAHQIKRTSIAASQLLIRELPQRLKILIENSFGLCDHKLTHLCSDGKFPSRLIDFSISIDEVIRPLLKKYATFFISKIAFGLCSLKKVVTDSKWLGVIVEQVLSKIEIEVYA